MAEIVGGFLLPHDPFILQTPEAAPADQRERVLAAFARIRDRVGELGATVAIVIGADHYILFGPGCLPAFLIGVGDLEGPLERLPGVARGPVAAHPELAGHIMRSGREAGFDWAVAKTLILDHSIMVPHHFCLAAHAGLATVPVYLASGVEPLIAKRRAYDLGGSIGEAVRSYPGAERVVVIGSGGISHWVGTAEMGRVNSEFDRRVLSLLERGDTRALIELDDAEIVREGGNGALEIRNFLCALGALGPAARARTIAYEPSPAWITGLGFSELLAAA
jgi:protocatechuate 4,5-dioxygenase, beta chain